jgi:hypothetical protein
MDISQLSGLGSTSGRTAPAQKSDRQASDWQPESSERRLVPVAPDGAPAPARKEQPETSPRRSPRPSPAFLAQLIATAQHAPQTRARGRIAPADAIAHYTSAASVSAPTNNWDWSL